MTDGTSSQNPAQLVATLDGTGTATWTLYANDDSTTSPQGTWYYFIERIKGAPINIRHCSIPHAGAGSVDMLALAEVTTIPTYAYVLSSTVGQPNGVASLDNTGHVPAAQIPTEGSEVLSFNTRTGAVTLMKADVTGTGLAAADVGADASGAAAAEQTRALAAEALLAPLQSPTFTGTPLVTTTPAMGDSTKKVADTEFVLSELTRYNVLDHGAVGDGTTDDSTAITNTLALGGITWFPPGKVFACHDVAIPNGAVLMGGGYLGLGSPTPSSGNVSRIKRIDGSNHHLFTVGTSAGHCLFSNLYLDGNKVSDTAGDIIHATDNASIAPGQIVVDHCTLQSAPGIGIYFGTWRVDCHVMDSNIYGCYDRGVVFAQHATDGWMIGTDVAHSTGNNVEVGATATRIIGCDFWDAGGNGGADGAASLVVGKVAGTDTGCKAVLLQGNEFGAAGKGPMVLVNGSATGVSIVGNLLIGGFLSSDNTYSLLQHDSSGVVTVTNNVFSGGGGSANPSYCINLTGSGILYEGQNAQVLSPISGSGKYLATTGTSGNFVNVYAPFAGRIGVGTTTPGRILDVQGDSNSDPGLMRLQRNASGLSTTMLQVQAPDVTGSALVDFRITGDANPKWKMDLAGQMQWGAGGASAVDAILARTGAAELTATSTIKMSTQSALDNSTKGATTGYVDRGMGARYVSRTDGTTWTVPAGVSKIFVRCIGSGAGGGGGAAGSGASAWVGGGGGGGGEVKEGWVSVTAGDTLTPTIGQGGGGGSGQVANGGTAAGSGTDGALTKLRDTTTSTDLITANGGGKGIAGSGTSNVSGGICGAAGFSAGGNSGSATIIAGSGGLSNQNTAAPNRGVVGGGGGGNAGATAGGGAGNASTVANNQLTVSQLGSPTASGTSAGTTGTTATTPGCGGGGGGAGANSTGAGGTGGAGANGLVEIWY
jgi:hypothetical protein